MNERGNALSPRNVTTLPWKLEVEFDDTLTCKLYSQLSFSVRPLRAYESFFFSLISFQRHYST